MDAKSGMGGMGLYVYGQLLTKGGKSLFCSLQKTPKTVSGDNEGGRKEMPSAVEQGGPTTDTKTPNTNDTGSSFAVFSIHSSSEM